MKRLFLALWPDEQTRFLLTRISEQLDSSEFKPVKPENMHITLVFLGAVKIEAIPEISHAMSKVSVQPFTLMLDKLSYWKRSKVLCLISTRPVAGIFNLSAILTGLMEIGGFEPESQSYCPHVTLARKAQKKPQLDFTPLYWRAESFCLVESISTVNGPGPRYKVMKSWSF